MRPHHEPMAGSNGITTDVLIQRWGPITARGERDGAQFIAFKNGLSYWSSRFTCSDGSPLWLPWERTYSHSVERFARHMKIDVEHA